MKLLITGGHLTPALAIIDAIHDDTNRKIDIAFVGRKTANQIEKEHSLEYEEITARGITFLDLQAGRGGGFVSRHIFRRLKEVVSGFIDAFRIVSQSKPSAILTFGSYIGLPIAVAGFFSGVPVYVHDQTVRPGMSTQLIAQFAREVFVAFEDAKQYFPSRKTFVVGNPIRPQVFRTIKKPFEIPATHPVLYITGGSLGSHSINVLVEEILSQLLSRYTVIHQTGNVAEYDDFARLQSLKRALSPEKKQRYFPVQHVMTSEIGYVYSHADMVVSRAGANTFFELIALEKPAVLIPLPWSARGEQERHAEIFQDAGCGILFSQNDHAASLLGAIDQIMSNREQYVSNFKHLKNYYRHDAVQLILSFGA